MTNLINEMSLEEAKREENACERDLNKALAACGEYRRRIEHMYEYINEHLNIKDEEVVPHPDQRSWVTWEVLSEVFGNIRELFQRLQKLQTRIEHIEKIL